MAFSFALYIRLQRTESNRKLIFALSIGAEVSGILKEPYLLPGYRYQQELLFHC